MTDVSLWADIADTPIPQLLVIGGLVFLFLAVVGKVGARIVVAEQRQRMAGIIGSVLLVVGLVLWSAPHLGGGVPRDDQTAQPGARDPDTPKAADNQAAPGASSPPATSPQDPGRDDDRLLAESSEAWLTGRYDAALEMFADLRAREINPTARRLAAERYEWLSPYRGRILFADDFETDGVTNGSRWNTHPGAPPTGRGGATRMVADGEATLRLEDHYHASPRIDEAGTQEFEVRMRIRVGAAAGPDSDAHVNVMMDGPGGRTTVGIYGREEVLNVWEEKDGRELGQRGAGARYADWQTLRILVRGRTVRVDLDGETLVDYRSPRADPITLAGFNLESLTGTIWVDDVLIAGP